MRMKQFAAYLANTGFEGAEAYCNVVEIVLDALQQATSYRYALLEGVSPAEKPLRALVLSAGRVGLCIGEL